MSCGWEPLPQGELPFFLHSSRTGSIWESRQEQMQEKKRKELKEEKEEEEQSMKQRTLKATPSQFHQRIGPPLTNNDLVYYRWLLERIVLLKFFYYFNILQSKSSINIIWNELILVAYLIIKHLLSNEYWFSPVLCQFLLHSLPNIQSKSSLILISGFRHQKLRNRYCSLSARQCLLLC